MNSKDDESLLKCLAEFEHSKINLSTETEFILNNEKFSKDVNTGLLTCSGFLSSMKPHGESNDEEQRSIG